MNKWVLEDFERALRKRNPILADRLEPGLPEARVRGMLLRAKVQGSIEPVVELFSWKNGSRLDPSVAQHASPFPDSEYIFMDLELMIVHFLGFAECAQYHARYKQLVGRYFPLF